MNNMQHTEAERHVLIAARAYLQENNERSGAVRHLVNEGLSEVAAGLRADLVPMAFGWALLKKMGVVNFPSYFELTENGDKVKVSESHVFTAALGIAIGIFENGYNEIFSKKVVEMLIAHSAEVDALNKALNDNPNLVLTEISFSSKLVGYTASDYIENA